MTASWKATDKFVALYNGSRFWGGRKLVCPEKTLKVRLRSAATQPAYNSVNCRRGVRRDWCPLRQPDFPACWPIGSCSHFACCTGSFFLPHLVIIMVSIALIVTVWRCLWCWLRTGLPWPPPSTLMIIFSVYKSLNGLCPQYLTNLLEHRKSARSLCSNVQDLLIQPTCKTKT